MDFPNPIWYSNIHTDLISGTAPDTETYCHISQYRKDSGRGIGGLSLAAFCIWIIKSNKQRKPILCWKISCSA